MFADIKLKYGGADDAVVSAAAADAKDRVRNAVVQTVSTELKNKSTTNIGAVRALLSEMDAAQEAQLSIQALRRTDQDLGYTTDWSGRGLGAGLHAVCCMLYAVCCRLYAVCCMLYVVCCMLYAVSCMLYAVCCMM
jgi:hypothetical protein